MCAVESNATKILKAAHEDYYEKVKEIQMKEYKIKRRNERQVYLLQQDC